jgi:4-hydroxy 2-oxovalerate aldolase
MMKNIKLLDCTLRDGGYINDWRFGDEAIKNITRLVTESDVDIFEIGFLKNEPYQKDCTVYNDVDQISAYILPKKKNMIYAAMIEVVNPLPIEQLSPRTDNTIDAIRVIVWKRLLQEGYDYCKAVVKKGYKLCVQPARVDQYAHGEFVEMVKLFNTIDPFALYVVDSFGTQNKHSLMRYLELADKHLKPNTALGYHGHNNLLQAFGIAEAFLERNFDRDVIVDASVYGMGRGAGNLNIELFANYLNENHHKNYKIAPFLEVYEKYIKHIYSKSPWGYSLPLYLSALYHCNPMYGTYYGFDLNLDPTMINEILKSIALNEDDKIQFQKEIADRYLAEYKTRKGV